MSNAILIAQATGGITVDLWGVEFDLKPATRSVIAKAQEYEKKLEETENADELVNVLVQVLDLRVVPQNGKRKLASKVILEKWEADELALADLLDFAQRLSEVSERPT